MLLVGLTGGIGAGKSTAAAMLDARGATVIDADDLARRAVRSGTPAFDRIVDTFGRDVAAADVILDNGGSIEELEAQVDRLWSELERKARERARASEADD